MWSILFPINSLDADWLVYELWQQGTTGILEEADGLRAFFEDEVNQRAIQSLLPAASIRCEQDGYAQPAQAVQEPVEAGTRFFVVSARDPATTPTGRLRLVLNDSAAFGSGRHESTQLCLSALETCAVKGKVVVDIGSGSGILSAAASLLDAARIVSCDIHDDAVAATKLHAKSLLFAGSADALAEACADLVIANISAKALDLLAFDLKRIARPDAPIVIAGFLTTNPPQRFQPEKSFEQGDWSCWICRPSLIQAPEQPPGQALLHNAQWWL